MTHGTLKLQTLLDDVNRFSEIFTTHPRAHSIAFSLLGEFLVKKPIHEDSGHRYVHP